MKPHKHVRKGKGYCCRWCDGPYNKWKKKTRRVTRKTERQSAKKEMEAPTGIEPVSPC